MKPVLLLLSATALVAACSSPPTIGSSTSEPTYRVKTTRSSRIQLEYELEASVLDGYSQLNLGNIDAYRESLVVEGEVDILRVHPGRDLFGRVPDALPDPRIYRQFQPTILSKNLDVHVSAVAPIGWVYDEISYRVLYAGRTASIPVRRTGVYTIEGGRWALLTEHNSYPLPLTALLALAANGRIPAPTEFPTRKPMTPAGEKLVKLVRRVHLTSGDERESLFSAAPDALILFPGLDGEFRGARVRQAPRLVTLFGPNAKIEVGAVRIAFAPGNRLARVTAEIRITNYLGAAHPQAVLGLRGTYVLEDRDEFDWQIVQTHVSAALAERELSAHVFGDPSTTFRPVPVE